MSKNVGVQGFVVRPGRGLAHLVAFGGAVPAVEGDKAGLELEFAKGAEELFALATGEAQLEDAKLNRIHVVEKMPPIGE